MHSSLPFHSLNISKLQDSLAIVLALQHPNESLGRILHSLSDMHQYLNLPVLNPFTKFFLVLVPVFRTKIRIEDYEPSERETPSYYLW
jgi:hypothetical protein